MVLAIDPLAVQCSPKATSIVSTDRLTPSTGISPNSGPITTWVPSSIHGRAATKCATSIALSFLFISFDRSMLASLSLWQLSRQSLFENGETSKTDPGTSERSGLDSRNSTSSQFSITLLERKFSPWLPSRIFLRFQNR